jgi:pilus biogenesis lipoprotein CpaD
MKKNIILTMAAAASMSACSHMDMQGIDPKDFYVDHPVENTTETRHMLYTMNFKVDKSHLSGDAIDDFQSAVQDIFPEAVESVIVKLAPSQMANEERRQHIIKLLRGQGYEGKVIHFEAAKETHVREAQLDISYAAVVTPHCPDWRTSPITTFSNTTQGNIGCSSVVNLGLQVANPRDLEKGNGMITPDAERNALVIHTYKTGGSFAAPSSTSGTGSGSSSGDASTASSGAQ